MTAKPAGTHLTPPALRFLAARNYPGNDPELESLLTRALPCAQPGQAIDAPAVRNCDIMIPAASPPHTGEDQLQALLWNALKQSEFSLEGLNRQIYGIAMAMADGNVSCAARMLEHVRGLMNRL